MSDNPPSSERLSERSARLTRVVDDVIDRRRAGEDVSDEAITTAYPDLMPELGRRLRDLRRIEFAERLADQAETAADPPPSASAAAGEGPPALPPDSFVGYRVEREIQRGGQGVVYQALQETTGRPVAIKVMREGPFAGSRGRARFEREVRILASLKHPNIVTVHDSGTVAGCSYFVMDYISGAPLDEYVRTRLTGAGGGGDRVSLAELLGLFVKICRAVNVAHLRGVIHRDLKPGNIRVDPSGEPYILDFGLAKVGEDDVLANSSSEVVTMTGQIVGSLPWASPEQAEGRPELIDLRTDVYSLGVILYQMLTGAFPYAVTGTLAERIDAIQNVEPTRPRSISRRIDGELETIMLKSLSKERERRYQTAGELARDVEHYLAGEVIEAKRDSAGYLLRKALRRHRAAAVIAGVFVLMITASTIALSILYAQQRLARAGEQEQRERAEARERDALAARSEALARAEQLATLTEFQKSMLSEVDAAKLGRGIVNDQRDRIREQLLAEEASPEDVDAALASFDHLMTNVNATDVALRVIDESVLGRAAARIDQQFTDQPETEAALRLAVGDTYRALGLYAQARPQLERALEVRRRNLGDDEQRTLEAMRSLAEATTYLGDFSGAEALYRQALDGARRTLGEIHPDTLDALRGFGALRALSGNLKEAEPLLRQVLEGRRQALGDDHPDTLRSASSLGFLLQTLDRNEEAEPLIREALEGQRRVLGSDHPHTLSTLGSMGHLLASMDRDEEAEALYREALAGERRALGDDHPHTLASLTTLGWHLNKMGRVEDAQRCLREDLETSRRVLGADNPATASASYNLGELLAEHDRNDEAEPYLRDAYASFRRTMGENHPYTLGALNRLGWLLTDLERYDEAEPICRDAAARRRRVLGDDHSDTLDSIYNVGRLLSLKGEYTAAEPFHREALAGRREQLGADALDTLWSQYFLAQTLIEQGKFAEGEPLALDCYRRNLEQFGPSHEETVDAIQLLIDLYSARHAAEPDGGFDDVLAEWRAKLPTPTIAK